MASSRESSPLEASSPTELTPRSKVKAMLAVLDSSDDESVAGNSRERLASKFNKLSTSKQEVSTNNVTERTRTRIRVDASNQSTSEDDDEDIVRPKGRLAARMQAAVNNSDEEAIAKDPRERVKRLLQKKATTEPSSATEAEKGAHGRDTSFTTPKRKAKTIPRPTPKSSPRRKSASPGLFVTPDAPRSASPSKDASDSDKLPLNPASSSNKRFQELVEKKRQERREKDEAARREKAEKAAERRRQAALIEEDDADNDSEDEGGRRLTQRGRPSRKASKKAIEEMHRETQRMSRNMQLAHEAKTKKKITKESLFAKFNYKQPVPDIVSSDPARPPSSSSTHAPQADVEMRETPPTSPVPEINNIDKEQPQEVSEDTIMFMDEDEGELPTLEEAMAQLPSSPPSRIDKGKGKAIDEQPGTTDISKKSTLFKQRPMRVRPAKDITPTLALDDSDSDIEIVKVKKSARDAKLDALFKRVPAEQAKEPHSMVALRMLAHLTSPGKRNSGRNQKPSITAKDLQISLQQRARQQATREREERIQALRDKGVIVQTAEEREKEMAEVDDLLAKARREGEEIKAREKAAAKKERKANGEPALLDDSSDDEDWEEYQEVPEGEASGIESEEEDHDDSGNNEDEEDDEDQEEENPNPIFDDEAGEDEAEESEIDLSIKEDAVEKVDLGDDEDELPPIRQKSGRSRVPKVISDDEKEEEAIKQTPRAPRIESSGQPRTDSPAVPTSVLRSAKRTFIPGLTVAGPAGLGLTQIFAGTMDDTQDIEPESATQDSIAKDDSASFLRRCNTGPDLPPFVPTMSEEESQDIVMDSQAQVPESQAKDSQTQPIQISFSQSQVHGFDSLLDNPMSTQMSEFPLTQDGGFQMMTPIKGRFVDPPSTIGTVALDPQREQAAIEALQETPAVKKKGKLRRRAEVASFSDDDEALAPITENANENEDFEISANAFDVMRKASKKKKTKVVDDFDKKKSEAKDMVNEQAEESEDEYAGLGGASDDESGEEEDALVKEMIDDEKKDIDENELAKFYADRERANDEKQIEKLYKDISKGMLRRKRGADYDLSDSDDGGEARQRRKRAEFAKMRKALLADERIGKIAENPKRLAFLRAIEDRGSDDELGFLEEDFPEKEEESEESQSQTQNEQSNQAPDDEPTQVMGPPKRKRDEEDTNYIRPPPNLRRTKNASKKPSNLSEIRKSVSDLIEDPHAMITSLESASDTDSDLEIEGAPELNKENRDPFAIRRSGASIIDRISLKRASSSNLSNNERLAFAAPSSAPGGFKVPALLRKATGNSGALSTSSITSGTSTTERMAGGTGSEGIGMGMRKGAGKNSGVNYFARESERRAAVERNELRREKKKFRGVDDRRRVVGGLFGKGKFE